MNNSAVNKDMLITTISGENKILRSQLKNLKSIVEIQKDKIKLLHQKIATFEELAIVIEELKKRNGI